MVERDQKSGDRREGGPSVSNDENHASLLAFPNRAELAVSDAKIVPASAGYALKVWEQDEGDATSS